jgi:hypothetical protein
MLLGQFTDLPFQFPTPLIAAVAVGTLRLAILGAAADDGFGGELLGLLPDSPGSTRGFCW